MVSEIFIPADKPSYRKDDGQQNQKQPPRRALIYFICGNPGLIEFYSDFLGFLHALLRASAGVHTMYDIYGRNLLGFSDSDHAPFGEGNPPFDLRGQIEGAYEDVVARGEEYDFVVVMGHSVGAYIAVELFARYLKRESELGLDLRKGILLFPTLTHLALSASGRKMALLRRFSWLDSHAHVLAKGFLYLLPEDALQWIVANWMGFSESTSAVTARWLKSRDGVWQALHLGKHEIDEITEEKWEEELWEAAQEPAAAEGEGQPRFYLFYGREDHWVEDRVRDEFVEGKKGVARIVVDDGDLPHAFCTREETSWVVARKVCQWVEEIDGGLD